jgi:alkanesulfonate monooxygenase SsuD/methylene tetrahydromethanopterin reductase-like flavin-dependent oxidoreductase (luciferase family)
VEFSTLVLTMYLDSEDQPEDDERILHVAIDQSLTCAQLGMNPFFTEHHFRGPWHSTPMQFAAYLAPQIPADCYLGFAVLSMPFYHPVRLVEGMNLLDQLTKGHALFGLGSGFPGLEPAGMGLTVEHHGSSRAADEALAVMQRLWDYQNGDPALSFETERYRGTIVKRPVPAPYRKHHPHVLVTARRPAALARAGENGWPMFVGSFDDGDDARSLEQLRAYRQALAAAGHAQDVIEECMRWTCFDVMNVALAETDDEAQANAEQARADRNAMRDIFTARNHRLADAIPIAEELGPSRPAASNGHPPGERRRAELIGSPDTVARRIQQLSDWGINHLLLRFMGEWSGQTRTVAERSMRLFSQEVMPRFRDIPPLRDPLAVDLRTEEVTRP